MKDKPELSTWADVAVATSWIPNADVMETEDGLTAEEISFLLKMINKAERDEY